MIKMVDNRTNDKKNKIKDNFNDINKEIKKRKITKAQVNLKEIKNDNSKKKVIEKNIMTKDSTKDEIKDQKIKDKKIKLEIKNDKAKKKLELKKNKELKKNEKIKKEYFSFKDNKNKNSNKIKYIVLISFFAMLMINFLANYLPLNSQTSGAVSDKYFNLFAPPGFIFSIWGVIYLLLAVFVFMQFSDSFKSNDILKLFIYSCVLNFIWIFAWHYELILLSALLIIGLLISLALINNKLKDKFKDKHTLKELITQRLPFSIYFGWVSVAVIANVTALLVYLGFNNILFSNAVWTVLVLLIGLILGTFVGLKNKDIFYLFVFVWAYFGIFTKHILEFQYKYPLIVYTSAFSIIVFLITIFCLIRRMYCKKQ